MLESGDVVLRTKQVADSLEYIERLKQAISEQNLSAEQAERALQPALSFHAQMQEELDQLERTERG